MFFEVTPDAVGSSFLCCLFYICSLPCQVVRNKYDRLMSAAPVATLDCSVLWVHQLLLSAVSHAAAKHACSPL